MRTNPSGVTEVAHIRTNKAKFDEGWDRIFGKKETEQLKKDLEESNQNNSQPLQEEPSQDLH